jgi:hypothetical protein
VVFVCYLCLSFLKEKTEPSFRESNVRWNEVKEYANFDPRITQPTGPKPDFTYGFPINRTHDHLPVGFRCHESVTNFSLEVLGKLRSAGLISSPLSGLHTWTKNRTFNLSQSHLICFPWAVVELKPVKVHQSPIQFCYCQAANGASAALKLYENLSKHATGGNDNRIPPIVAFTCIGPEIRVWLAYSCTQQDKPVCHVGRTSFSFSSSSSSYFCSC